MRIFMAVLLLLLFFSGCMEYTIAAPFSLAPHGWQAMGVLETDMTSADLTNIKAGFDGAGRLYCAYERPGNGIQVKRLRSGRWEALSVSDSPAPHCSNMQFVVTEGGTPYLACGSNNHIIIRHWDGSLWHDVTNFQHTGWKALGMGFDHAKNVIVAYRDTVNYIYMRSQSDWTADVYITDSAVNYSFLQPLSSATFTNMIYATGPGVTALLFATTNASEGWEQFPDTASTNGQALVDKNGRVIVAALRTDQSVILHGAGPLLYSWVQEPAPTISNVNAYRMAQYRSGTEMFLSVRTFNTPPIPDEAVTLYQANPWRQYSDPADSPVVLGHALAVSPADEVWMVAVVETGDVGGSTYHDLRAWRYRP